MANCHGRQGLSQYMRARCVARMSRSETAYDFSSWLWLFLIDTLSHPAMVRALTTERRMKITFERRWSSDIAFEIEIGDEFKKKSVRDQRGEAIKKALKEKCNLRGSNLRGSNLRGSDLSGSDLRDSNLSGSNLRGSDLRGSNLSGVPKIENIHQAIYAAASKPEALDMRRWHSCETTHCRAGWVVTLAGEGGKALEWAFGTPAAAAIIYMASDPTLEKIPNFYAGNEDALADMRRLAELEKSKEVA
ncbi:MAG: pentapeptide repeat-containing protein [Acidobacteriaceae bacterium]